MKISSSGPYPLLKMDIFVNSAYLGTHEASSSFYLVPSELENLQAENELKIIAYDSVYNRTEASLLFKVKQ